MATLKQLEREVKLIKERNKRVEADKAWETSWARRLVIAAFTYAVIVLFFISAKLPDPFANAVVPTVAFILSTSSLPFFKEQWKKRCFAK